MRFINSSAGDWTAGTKSHKVAVSWRLRRWYTATASARAKRRAWQVSRRQDEAPASGEIAACFAQSIESRKSSSVPKKRLFEFPPSLCQIMSSQDIHESRCLQNIRFDEPDKCLFHQRTRGRQKLHRPTMQYNVLAFDPSTPCHEVVENGLRTDQNGVGFFPKRDEDVHIQCGHRFQVERRPDRATDRIASDNSVRRAAATGSGTARLSSRSCLPGSSSACRSLRNSRVHTGPRWCRPSIPDAAYGEDTLSRRCGSGTGSRGSGHPKRSRGPVCPAWVCSAKGPCSKAFSGASKNCDVRPPVPKKKGHFIAGRWAGGYIRTRDWSTR